VSEERPLVSFILVAYKQENFIREAVRGALLQTYEPLEIIISDDCSPDRTFEFIKEEVSAYNGPHKVILNRNAKNMGIGGNYNQAFQLAHGELFVTAGGGKMPTLPLIWSAPILRRLTLTANLRDLSTRMFQLFLIPDETFIPGAVRLLERVPHTAEDCTISMGLLVKTLSVKTGFTHFVHGLSQGLRW